ncbi:hypothetical protein [Paenibacillus whitsoniae]|uniref:Uncharacterized protein n=1 Tax=Paenibacillus whitsoniae TaxID=2496558 RepID=A0A3S0C8G1_9BACL|nr:hypothetical protein [Paenibacillus whitsoniae]RTE06451.1 hypothetical protein EJQ19_22980 [Paenibacillus whitsoniae]
MAAYHLSFIHARAACMNASAIGIGDFESVNGNLIGRDRGGDIKGSCSRMDFCPWMIPIAISKKAMAKTTENTNEPLFIRTTPS